MVYATPTKKARIYHMRTHGASFREIGRELGVSDSTVRRNYALLSENPDFYAKTPKPGRPSKFSQGDRNLATRKIHSGVARDGADLKRQFFPDLSYCTIRRKLAEMGLHGRRRCKKFMLTKIHIQKRRKWAAAHREWSTAKWKKVIFSDESKFTIFGSDGTQYCRRGVGEEFRPQNIDPRVKYGGGKVMVWGCITPVGFGRLYRIKGNMNAEMYCEILEEALIGTLRDHGLALDDIIFQQDNDRKHTSKLAKKWFSQKNITTLDWPPNSPDMNIIEHAWGALEHRVHRKHPFITNEDQLWEALQQEWAEMSLEYKENLYTSMRPRVHALEQAKGTQNKY